MNQSEQTAAEKLLKQIAENGSPSAATSYRELMHAVLLRRQAETISDN